MSASASGKASTAASVPTPAVTPAAGDAPAGAYDEDDFDHDESGTVPVVQSATGDAKPSTGDGASLPLKELNSSVKAADKDSDDAAVTRPASAEDDDDDVNADEYGAEFEADNLEESASLLQKDAEVLKGNQAQDRAETLSLEASGSVLSRSEQQKGSVSAIAAESGGFDDDFEAED